MVGDARDVIGRVKDRANFFPLDEMDMGMWWWYPLPFKNPATQAAAALEGEEATARWNEMTPPSFLTQAKTDKPLWVGVQSYRKKGLRYPTPLEYRSQAYIAIIHGAKGLMWYGGYVHGGIFNAKDVKEPKDARDPKDVEDAEGHWDYLKKLARELNDLSPVLLAPSIEMSKFQPDNALISVCLKQTGDRLVLLAANRGAEAVEVTFSSPKFKKGSAKVLSEDREVKISGGELRDKFESYGVHVYQLP
jgi:hypothetical protein